MRLPLNHKHWLDHTHHHSEQYRLHPNNRQLALQLNAMVCFVNSSNDVWFPLEYMSIDFHEPDTHFHHKPLLQYLSPQSNALNDDDVIATTMYPPVLQQCVLLENYPC